MKDRLSREESRQQTRERLLDAAAEVFAARGFEAATIDQVAAAAGYTKGAVYSNFASKTDLFIALIERRIEVQAAHQARRMDEVSLEEQLAQSGRQHRLRDADRQWLILSIEFWLHAMRDPRAAAAVAEQYRRARQMSASLMAGWFERAGKEPPMAAGDLAVVAESLATGLAIQAALDPDQIDMALHAEVLSRFLGVPEPVDSTSEARPEG